MVAIGEHTWALQCPSRQLPYPLLQWLSEPIYIPSPYNYAIPVAIGAHAHAQHCQDEFALPCISDFAQHEMITLQGCKPSKNSLLKDFGVAGLARTPKIVVHNQCHEPRGT